MPFDENGMWIEKNIAEALRKRRERGNADDDSDVAEFYYSHHDLPEWARSLYHRRTGEWIEEGLDNPKKLPVGIFKQRYYELNPKEKTDFKTRLAEIQKISLPALEQEFKDAVENSKPKSIVEQEDFKKYMDEKFKDNLSERDLLRMLTKGEINQEEFNELMERQTANKQKRKAGIDETDKKQSSSPTQIVKPFDKQMVIPAPRQIKNMELDFQPNDTDVEVSQTSLVNNPMASSSSAIVNNPMAVSNPMAVFDLKQVDDTKSKLGGLVAKLEVIIDKGVTQVTDEKAKHMGPHALSAFIQNYTRLIEIMREIEMEEENDIDIASVIAVAPYELKLQFQELWTKMMAHWYRINDKH